MSPSIGRKIAHPTAVASLLALMFLASAPAAQAIHTTNVCEPTTEVCFRVELGTYIGDFVPSTSPDPTGVLHVSTGLLRVDLAVDYVEFVFTAVDFTPPGGVPDWSEYDQAVANGVGTTFLPGSVTSTPVDVTFDPNDPGSSQGNLWNARYQVWLGDQKLVDVPGFACVC